MRTILLVEGAEIMRHALAKALTRAGYEVLQASSGPEARDLLESNPREVDLLITETELDTEMTGVSLLSQVKADHPRMPVLYLSAKPLAGSPYTFLVRPFGLEEFMRRIGKILNRRAAERRSGAAAWDPAAERRQIARRNGNVVSLITFNPQSRYRHSSRMSVST